MNKEKRKRIADAIEQLEEAAGTLEEVREDEQESHDNLPENLQRSKAGWQIQENIDILGSMITIILEASDALYQLTLKEAKNERRIPKI